jgi:hypothetical protein
MSARPVDQGTNFRREIFEVVRKGRRQPPQKGSGRNAVFQTRFKLDSNLCNVYASAVIQEDRRPQSIFPLSTSLPRAKIRQVYFA